MTQEQLLKNGIWQFDKEISSVENNENLMGDTSTFILLDKYIVLRLVSFSVFNDRPPDDVYMLMTKWEGNILYFLPPLNNQWQKLVLFENNIFVMYGGWKKRLYKKISAEEVVVSNKNLLRQDISLWDYEKHGIIIH